LNILIEVRDDGISDIVWAERCRAALIKCLNVVVITEDRNNYDVIGTGDDLKSMNKNGLSDFSGFSVSKLNIKESYEMLVQLQEVLNSDRNSETVFFWNVSIFKMYFQLDDTEKSIFIDLLKKITDQQVFVNMERVHEFDDFIEISKSLSKGRWEGLCLLRGGYSDAFRDKYISSFPLLNNEIQRAHGLFSSAIETNIWCVVDKTDIKYYPNIHHTTIADKDKHPFINENSMFIN
jgi:hypothetical protein